jgi:hypothetical protein
MGLMQQQEAIPRVLALVAVVQNQQMKHYCLNLIWTICGSQKMQQTISHIPKARHHVAPAECFQQSMVAAERSIA